jgi:hypothetical protein
MGGVTAFSKEQFNKINGYSNLVRLRKVEIDFKALIILILIFRLVFWLGR